MTTLLFVLLGLILISLGAGFYAIVKQQGRILLRLDQLEQSPRAATGAAETSVPQPEPPGIPVDADCPGFRLPDLTGKSVTLEDFRGRRLLLVHWDFQCGFCGSIAAELARLQPAFERQNARLALLSSGDAQSNHEHAAELGLTCAILLRNNEAPGGPFANEGTPVAYLLDEQGRVAAPVARGSDQVLPLARKLAGEESGPALQVEPQTQQVIDFPDFECPDLGGEMVALQDFRGRRVVLVHWNFDCGFCATIAPELARLEPKLEERNFRLVLLAKGDSQFNRERASTAGLKCRILLLQDRKTPRPFEHRGTPVAYLLDENGRTASPFASGRDEVLSLVRGAAGEDVGAARNAGSARAEPDGQPRLISTPGRHRINLPGFILRGEIGFGDVIKRVTSAFGIKTCLGCERRAAWLNRWLRFSGAIGEGLKAGTRAPVFRLPDLQGRMISLKEYQGRRVLLVFSDPNCGPCDELAPHLVRLHEEHEANGLDLILVGHGDADENRRKAEQYGFRFPVLLQPNWQLSDKYGIRATPVAFLIKEDGVIAEDAAAGRDPIMALAQTGAAVLI